MSHWFCALLDTASDVYFRYALAPARGFAYVSPSVEALTGRPPADFYADRDLCLTLVAGRDRRLLRRVLRARRGVTLKLTLMRHDVAIPVEVRTVALVRQGRVVAIEGVARLDVAAEEARPGRSDAANNDQPVQQRLAALMYEVHDLLHRVLPPAPAAPVAGTHVLRLGSLALDTDRLTVTDSGQPVALTTREVLVLRYLLERPGRIVTRQQFLTDVWAYSYTGDDRTVDVHISRLRRKLPSLREHLATIRNVGYRLDIALEAAVSYGVSGL
jgi:DNA-binding winged helix-turn-helix (wHTH) protein